MRKVEIRAEIEKEIDAEISAWADAEERSKTRHVSILLRKLTQLRKTNPDALARLGLADAGLAVR